MPLGGQQYIIVDQKLQQKQTSANRKLSSPAVKAEGADKDSEGRDDKEDEKREQGDRSQSNAPYCLKCFDMVFGETCEHCGKLITCDSGAINHERRCWHASASCFKCYSCAKSLLGSPFLPTSDGHIYCSMRCSEAALFEAAAAQSGAKSATGVIAQGLAGGKRLGNGSVGGQPLDKLHLASYCDPRAPHGALQHQLTLSALSGASASAEHNNPMMAAMSAHLLNEQHQAAVAAKPDGNNNAAHQRVGLLRHKALIDYLLANARSDETSHQLLNYLYNQFSSATGNGRSSNKLGYQSAAATEKDESTPRQCGEEERLMEEIGNTMELIARERAQQALTKSTQNKTKDQIESLANADRLRRNKLNPFLIDSFGAVSKQLGTQTGMASKSANLMMNEKFQVNELHRQQALANYINLDRVVFENNKADRTDPIGNSEVAGGKTDAVDSAVCALQQRPTIHTKLAAGKQYGFKASQCSPAASLVSNEGTISDHSATSSGVSSSNAAPCGSVGGGTGSSASANNDGSQKSHSPLSSTSSHSSVSSSSTTSSTPATTAVGPFGSHQICEGGAPTGAPAGDAGKHFRPINSIAATLERRRRVQPITELSVLDLLSAADDQLEQHQRCSDGFEQLVSHFESSKRSQQPFARPPQRGAQFKPNAMDARSQQQESFFYELAQRLPKTPGQRAPVDGPSPQMQHLMAGGRPMPLDTNGLPTVDSDAPKTSTSGGSVGNNAARTITDHYSTVNKATKLAAKQTALGGTAATELNQQQDNFFAITLPLLNCQTDGGNLAQPNPMRPTSSLSMLAPPTSGQTGEAGKEGPLHASYSTGSLSNANQQTAEEAGQPTEASSQMLLQPGAGGAPSSRLLAAGGQKTVAKPTKSVSFDPTVKDPPSSGSMTLGRNSALKSALKSSSMSWLPQDHLSAFEQQRQAQFNVASGGTMPASLASQLKAGGSLSAYSAYYDEYGRRIRLSSLLAQPQLAECDQEAPTGDETKKSLLSGAISKLTASQSSRGGRRKMREQQQQQGTSAVLTSQPSSSLGDLFVQPISEQQLQMQVAAAQQQQFGPSTSGLKPAAPAPSRRRHQRRYSGSSHRQPTSRRDRSRRRSSGSRQDYRPRSRRYCTDENCYDTDGDSSRCSTCSDSSDDEDYSDSDLSRCSSADSYSSSASQTPYSSTDCSSEASRSDDEYTVSSSASSSRSSSACSSRASSPAPASGQEGGGLRAKPSRSSRARHGSRTGARDYAERRHRRTSERHRHSNAPSTTSGRGQQPRSERRSARSGRRSSRSSSHSGSSSRSSRRNGGRRNYSSCGDHSQHHERRRRHRRSSERNKSYAPRQRHHPSTRSSRSVAHLQPPMPVLAPQQYNQHQLVACAGAAHPSCFMQPQASINSQSIGSDLPPNMAPGGHHNLLRAKSPSTVSTDSKSVNNDCRII